jgi:hypothetical protein
LFKSKYGIENKSKLFLWKDIPKQNEFAGSRNMGKGSVELFGCGGGIVSGGLGAIFGRESGVVRENV